MSAILCRKRSFFEDLSTSTPISKRTCCSSSSPIRISPPRFNTANAFSPRASSPSSLSADQSRTASLLAHLQALFPNMDKELLGRALEEYGDDMDSTIRRLNRLCRICRRKLGSSVAKEDIALEGTSSAAIVCERRSLRILLLMVSLLAIETGTFGCGNTIVEGEDFITKNITFENSAPQIGLV